MTYHVFYKENNAHDDLIWSCKFGSCNENDNFLVTGSLDASAKLWSFDAENGLLTLSHTFPGNNLGVVSVDISEDGKFIGTCALDAVIRIWDRDSGKLCREFAKSEGPADAWLVAFSPDNRVIATGTHGGKVDLYSFNEGQKVASLDTRSKFVLSLAASDDGRLLACGALDGIVSIFDMSTCRLVSSLEGHAMPVRALKFSRDSKMLGTASDDCLIKLYNVYNFKFDPCGTLAGHSSWVVSLDFTSDNKYVASASSDKSVKLWDLEKNALDCSFTEHADQAWSVSFDKNDILASVSDDKSILLYRKRLSV